MRGHAGGSELGERQVLDPSAVDEWTWRRGAKPLPRTADVVVIGGGIVGCSTAWFLASRGVSVVLCEKGRVAGEQSGRNWGWVRQQGRSPVELPLMIESRRLWSQLAVDTGEDVGFTPGGCLYLAETARDLETLGAWLTVAREFGLDTTLLPARELSRVLLSSGRRWAGALYTASDGRAEPNRAAPAIARAAVRVGARVVTSCAVRGVERSAGRVHSVVTEHGIVIAPAVLCAAGAWTSLFCRSLDITIPQLQVRGTVMRTAPTARMLDGTAWSPHVAVRRRCDGGYTVAHGGSLDHAIVPDSFRFAMKFLPALRQEHGAIRLRVGRELIEGLRTPRQWALDAPSPFEATRVLDPQPDRRALAEIGRALERWFPEIASAPMAQAWAGMIETSPDVLPMISPVPSLAGFFIATGFSGHGFGLGPGAGRLVADMVTNRASSSELAPFRLDRFFDGSPIHPGPTI